MTASYAGPSVEARYDRSVGLNTPPDQKAGLCASCIHAKVITSSRGSVFYQCGLSFVDDRFPKYPALPVLRCDGYVREAGSKEI
jgi:hypothetical protein